MHSNKISPLIAALAMTTFMAVPQISWAAEADDSQPAASVSTSSPAVASGPVVIPERTEIRLIIDQDLKSGQAKENEEVRYLVKRDITDDKGRILIKSDTPAYGRITQSKRHGAFGAAGKLAFTCDFIQMPDGTKIPLRKTDLSSYGRDNRTATVATAVLLAPVALFINGRDVTVKRGAEYVMYVDKTTQASLTPETTPGVTPASSGTAGKSVFMTKEKKAYVGSLASFDGATYKITTDAGTVTLNAADVESITAVQ